MNKAICWRTDERFIGDGTEYICSSAFAKYEDAVVSVTDKNGEEVIVSINDPDFDFIFRNKSNEQWGNERLLKSKGFSLNTYPEGAFWELEVKDGETLKEKICNIFKADIELFVGGTDIETLILQCTEDFTKCIFYYDCNPFDMDTEDFLKCVEMM